jgi:hypothetical protein
VRKGSGLARLVFGRVVSRSLKSVGPNARLVADDLEGAIRLAHSLTELGLIDEYRPLNRRGPVAR